MPLQPPSSQQPGSDLPTQHEATKHVPALFSKKLWAIQPDPETMLRQHCAISRHRRVFRAYDWDNLVCRAHAAHKYFLVQIFHSTQQSEAQSVLRIKTFPFQCSVATYSNERLIPWSRLMSQRWHRSLAGLYSLETLHVTHGAWKLRFHVMTWSFPHFSSHTARINASLPSPEHVSSELLSSNQPG